ncbi:MAG: hypothetical protein LH649_14000 [Pseudanabaena sp. CAN_BIN31]|nr:hypothetical protein [Pseudanabaena sp. CAN_BIN31]
MRTKGYDFFITKPNANETFDCNVCSTECDVKRNVDGFSGFIAAMARLSEIHDEFTCPNVNQEWHEQAVRLLMEIEKTPSKRIAALLKLDLEELLEEHLAL